MGEGVQDGYTEKKLREVVPRPGGESEPWSAGEKLKGEFKPHAPMDLERRIQWDRDTRRVDEKFQLRVTSVQLRCIRELAKRHDTNVSVLVRSAIDWMLEDEGMGAG